LDCGWYLDYLKDYTPSSKIALHKKIDLGFQSRLHASLTALVEASNKRGRRKGKEHVKEIEDILDMMREYVKVPLHGSTPST
jgi:hypothetical protein